MPLKCRNTFEHSVKLVFSTKKNIFLQFNPKDIFPQLCDSIISSSNVNYDSYVTFDTRKNRNWKA